MQNCPVMKMKHYSFKVHWHILLSTQGSCPVPLICLLGEKENDFLQCYMTQVAPPGYILILTTGLAPIVRARSLEIYSILSCFLSSQQAKTKELLEKALQH